TPPNGRSWIRRSARRSTGLPRVCATPVDDPAHTSNVSGEGMIPGGLRGRDHKSTFDQRGSSYHLAMTSLPNVRAEEFRVLVARAELRPGHAIVDLPSGGGYLHRYLPEGVTCLHVETSQVFHAAAHHAGQKALLASSMGDVPLASGSVDRVLSLAGLHHETDRLPLYREA